MATDKRLWDRHDFECRVLADQKQLEIHLIPDGSITGELIECSTYNYLLMVKNKKVIIPKHAIKYIILIDS